MCVAALGLAGCATGPKGVRFIDGAGGAGSKPVAQPIQQFGAGGDVAVPNVYVR